MKMGCMLVNYNNGSGSRSCDLSRGPRNGQPPSDTSCLIPLFESYFATLATDCPLVVVDDGSTDDGPSIVERYGSRITQFIRREKNIGLTRNMNDAADILINRLGCDIICRFDGDIEFLTPGWDLRMIRYFETDPGAGAVGGLQLTPWGSIWAFGDMLIHPKGYCHILGLSKPGERADLMEIPMSPQYVLGHMLCDSVMGCLAAFRSQAWLKVGGLRAEFDELRGETEDLNLRLLLAGYTCVALGNVVFIHRHMEHARKETSVYDTQARIKDSFDIWPQLWGWHKMRPDFNAIYERWQGTPLTRNLVRFTDGKVEYIGP